MHNEPIANADPSGEYKFSLTEMLVVSLIMGMLSSCIGGTIASVKGRTQREIAQAQLQWFAIGFAVAAIIYGAVWFTWWLIAAATGAAGLGPEQVQQLLQNQQRLQHSFDRHWRGILNSWQQLRPIVERVLTNPKHVETGIKLRDGTLNTAYVAQVEIEGVVTWVTVLVYQTGPAAGEISTVVIPTIDQLTRAGLL